MVKTNDGRLVGEEWRKTTYIKGKRFDIHFAYQIY
jgi:hypothetical protein